MITAEEARRIARASGIDEYSIFREYAQIVMLKGLYAEKGAEEILAKGGTTIHLLLGGSRFSEDLDFTTTTADFSGITDRAASTAGLEIPGLVLKWERLLRTGRTARIRFTPPEMRTPLSIRLEFGIREKPLSRKVSVLPTLLPVAPYPMVAHLDWPEILAEKVRAILTRSQGRDIYDLWFLGTKGFRVDWEMVRKKLEYYRIRAGPEEARRRIQKFPEKELRQDLLPFLPRSQRPLLDQLKALALAALSMK